MVLTVDSSAFQPTFRGHVLQFLKAMSEACLDLLQHSYVSMTGLTIMLFLRCARAFYHKVPESCGTFALLRIGLEEGVGKYSINGLRNVAA
jgi:hypothetical protein